MAIVATAALLAAAGVAWWALSRPPAPEAVAHEFLSALADGDGARAVALIDGPPATAAHAAAALEGASDLIVAPEISRIATDEGAPPRVEAGFDLAGERRTVSFGLVERRGDWRIAPDALGVATPTTTLGDSVAIGGVLLPAGAAASLLPASYDVAAAPTGILAGATRIAVLPGDDLPVAIEASLSPDALPIAQARIDAYAQECAEPASAVPATCGIRVPWAADLTALERIAFRVEQLPQLALSPDGRTFAATGGVVVATATGTSRGGGAASFTYRADDWALRGSISFSGDEMVLRVD